MGLRKMLEAALHEHEWETSAYTEEHGVIEEVCKCGEYRHKTIDGERWIDGEHISAQVWREHVTRQLKVYAHLFMRS